MRKSTTLFAVAFLVCVGVNGKEALPQLFVPDGQLLHRPIQVYVSGTNLDERADPVLRLLEVYSSQNELHLHTNIWKPFFVAGGQSWTERVSGQTISRDGTILMFDLRDYELPFYKSTTRVTPVLSWTGTATNETAAPPTAIVGKPVYLGRGLQAFGWTFLAVGTLVALIAGLCKIKAGEKKKSIKGLLSLISGPDNYMSLWRTQLVAWTLAVGGMVFFFGIIQLQVPKIPETLVALMGMSVVTGGLSAVAARSKRQYQHDGAKDSEAPNKNHAPEFSDLISSYLPETHSVVLS
ncbi:MAG TPA: hypothetical protein VK327_03060, partial [Candidatus Paceibacterota bacterium]|nr:hypothetical protein [Candidatus Paceibacterota bacterium]